jgi:hypothetical protein
MPVFDLFSKRQKKLRGEVPDVYVYDNIPSPLRAQIVHIVTDAVGTSQVYPDKSKRVYEELKSILCREYGIFQLPTNGYPDNAQQEVFNFFLQVTDVEKALDVIEIAFKYIKLYIGDLNNDYNYGTRVSITPDAAVEELNDRFKEHGVGYSFDGGELIRVDSTYTHAEIVKPTIALLSNKKFSGPNDEYLRAHEHYRHGRNKECLTECLKAYESTMKTICTEKGWAYNPTDTAKNLLNVCFTNNLVPSFMQSHLTALKSVLENGIATVRNKLSGHGQGATPTDVNDEVARYGLNLTGSNIIFLIEQSGIK